MNTPTSKQNQIGVSKISEKFSHRVCRPSAFLNFIDFMPTMHAKTEQNDSDHGQLSSQLIKMQSLSTVHSTPQLKLPKLEEKFTRSRHQHTQSYKEIFSQTPISEQFIRDKSTEPRKKKAPLSNRVSSKNLDGEDSIELISKRMSQRKRKVEFNDFVQVLDFRYGIIKSEKLIDTSQPQKKIGQKKSSFRRVFEYDSIQN